MKKLVVAAATCVAGLSGAPALAFVYDMPTTLAIETHAARQDRAALHEWKKERLAGHLATERMTSPLGLSAKVFAGTPATFGSESGVPTTLAIETKADRSQRAALHQQTRSWIGVREGYHHPSSPLGEAAKSGSLASEG